MFPWENTQRRWRELRSFTMEEGKEKRRLMIASRTVAWRFYKAIAKEWVGRKMVAKRTMCARFISKCPRCAMSMSIKVVSLGKTVLIWRWATLSALPTMYLPLRSTQDDEPQEAIAGLLFGSFALPCGLHPVLRQCRLCLSHVHKIDISCFP